MAEENKNRSTFGRLLPEGRKKLQNDELLNESQLDKVNGGLSGDGPSEEQLKEQQQRLYQSHLNR